MLSSRENLKDNPQVLPSPPPSPSPPASLADRHANTSTSSLVAAAPPRPPSFASPPHSPLPSHSNVPRRSWTMDPLDSAPPKPELGWRRASTLNVPRPHDEHEEEDADITDVHLPRRPASFAAPIDTPPGSPHSEGQGLTPESYPPTSEEAAETRQIEENLRRWELAERQRRKSARDPTSPTTSVFSSAVSYLFPRNSTSSNSNTIPTHHLTAVPLDDGPSPRASTSSSNIPHQRRTHSRQGSDATVNAQDPESTPTKSSFALSRSPFADPSDQLHDEESSLMTPTASSSRSHGGPLSNASNRPALLTATSFSAPQPQAIHPRRRSIPAPQSFDIPQPLVPPPRAGSPVHGRAPEPHDRAEVDEDEEAFADMHAAHDPPVRWWTDWLCGCGPHREGDAQAGRTNPFE